MCWKKDATEFPVGVNYVEGRGASSSVPKLIVEVLGNPKEIVFVMKRREGELSSHLPTSYAGMVCKGCDRLNQKLPRDSCEAVRHFSVFHNSSHQTSVSQLTA